MSNPYRVVCAGIMVADHICEPLDRLPEAGELLATDTQILTIGGCALNTAVDLKKLGVHSKVVGVVGNDGFGDFLGCEAARYGLDRSGIRVTSEYPTSQTMIIPVKGEDRRFIHSFGANQALQADQDLKPEVFEDAEVLYLGGYMVLPQLSQEDLVKVFQPCRDKGIKTVLDVVTPSESEGLLSQLDQVLPLTDVFVPNDDEARLITGRPDPLDQARHFRDMGVGTVAITCGSRGCVVIGPDGAYRAGAYPVEVWDNSGGGDAFDAGFIVGMLEGWPTDRCVRFASAIGASAVRKLGTTAGVFERDEADAFIKAHQLDVETISL